MLTNSVQKAECLTQELQWQDLFANDANNANAACTDWSAYQVDRSGFSSTTLPSGTEM